MAWPTADGLMDACVFKAKCQVAVERVPVPALEAVTDAIVRVELCGLCGSDMHPYHCREQGLDAGTIMGHEFVGTVVQAGEAVASLRPGDRVMSPFTTCCGACFYCRGGLTCRCERGQLFGWVEGGRGLHGAQAQFVRVPLADATLVQVPEGVSDEEALLLGDIFATGFFCAHNAGLGGTAAQPLAAIPPPAVGAPLATALLPAGNGDAADGGAGAECDGLVVAVVGCGPVGLMAVAAARALGAPRVLAIDSLPERLALAQQLGAEAINRNSCNPLEAVRAATGGRGADVVLELVGAPSALRAAYDLVRPGGVISAVGCHTDPLFPFTPADAYNKNITFRTGRCPARYYMECLLPLVASKAVQDITRIITHRLPLRDAAAAYRLFDSKQEGCIKVVFRPWE